MSRTAFLGTFQDPVTSPAEDAVVVTFRTTVEVVCVLIIIVVDSEAEYPLALIPTVSVL